MTKKAYPEDIYKIFLESYKDYTLSDIQLLLIKSFEEVEDKFIETHKDIMVSIENDYSNCYYDGDSPSIVLQFKGIRLDVKDKEKKD